MPETTDQLMNDARCIDKCIPPGARLSVIIAELQQIIANGTGGGTPSGNAPAFTVLGNPTGAVAGRVDTSSPQISSLGVGVAPSIAGSIVTAASIIAGTFFRGNETALGAGTNLDWSLGDYFSKTLTANAVFTFSNTGVSRTITVAITGDASHTVTWPAVKWPGGVAPVQTLSKVDMYTFIQMGDGNIYGSAVQNLS